MKRVNTKKLPTVGFIKVGRIKATIARKAHIKAADIVIDNNHIKHINTFHGEELRSLGLTAIDYVKIVAATYTEIRKNKGTSILLVKVNQEKDDDTVTIELVLNEKTHQWEVRTAQPRRDLRNNELLYPEKEKAHPRRKSLF